MTKAFGRFADDNDSVITAPDVNFSSNVANTT